MTTFNRETKWGIFENGKFTKQFASSVEEARKYIVFKAREKLEEYQGDKFSQTKPLWYGQTPTLEDTPEPQYFMIYGLPGPNTSIIKIISCELVKGWIQTSITQEDVYMIQYETIHRVKIDNAPLIKQTPVEEIVKSQMVTSKHRDPENPRDIMLAAIEKGVPLKSCDEIDKI